MIFKLEQCFKHAVAEMLCDSKPRPLDRYLSEMLSGLSTHHCAVTKCLVDI